MNLEQQIEDQEEVQRYLQRKNVHQIMHDMIQQLLIHKPEDPLALMLDHLKKPQKKKIFLIGPPGLHLYKIAQKAISEKTQVHYTAFNSGEYFLKHKQSLPKQADQKIKMSRLIEDDNTNKQLTEEVAKFCQKQDFAIIEGFPKSLKQALQCHHGKVMPDKVIFVNVDKVLLQTLCMDKIKQHNPDLSHDEVQELAEHAANQYLMNIEDLKYFYPTYLEINGGTIIDEQQIDHQIKRCLQIKFGSICPRKNTRIIVIGAPHSGRTSLSQQIADKYNLIHISTASLITDQIRKGSVTGRKIKQAYENKQLIDDFLIQKLIQERIAKKDSQMQGYVLEGYPKTKQQWQNLSNLHIYPNFIIGLNPSQEQLLDRPNTKKDPDFPSRYKRWQELYEKLGDENRVFWVRKGLNKQNTFEQVCFEIEHHKL